MLEESGKLQLITRVEELNDESAALGDMIYQCANRFHSKEWQLFILQVFLEAALD